MKIAFQFYDDPAGLGGPTVNASRLLPALVARGHEVHALCMHHGGSSPVAERIAAQGVICHVRKWGGTTESMIRWLHGVIEAVQPDAFVPNLSVQGWYAAKWVRAAGIATVACLRSGDAFHWAMVDQFVLGPDEWAVSGLVCVSEALRDRVLARHPRRTRLAVIPSGVPVGEAVPDPGGPLRLAYVGRLVQNAKRIHELADALCRAVAAIPGATAVLIGEGPERAAVEEIIGRHGAADRVRLCGLVRPEVLHEELRRCNVLVLLSDYEGTPGAVMDGMACGLVPVCLDIPGGVRELVRHGETGLLVRDRDTDFIRALKLLQDDPELRSRLSLAARRHIMAGYSLESAADRWSEFLTGLVAAGGRKAVFRPPRELALPPVLPGLSREDLREASTAPAAQGMARRSGRALAHLGSSLWARLTSS